MVSSRPLSIWMKSRLNSNAFTIFSLLFLFFAFCASATVASASAPVYVQQCNQFVQYGMSATCTLSGVGAGHTLVIGIVNTAVGQSGTVTASSGTPTLAVSDGSILSAYILPNTSAGSNTITYTVTANTRIWLSVVEFSNTAASPLDGTTYGVSAGWNGSSFSSPSFNTTTASDLLWAFSAIPGGSTQTAGTAPITWTALTSPAGPGYSVLAEDGPTTTAGSYNGQFATTGTAGYEILTLALKPAATTPAATPTFSPSTGTYISPQSVTISDSTTGSTIYYTTDGTTPTTTSSVYSSPLPVASSQTVQAIATASGYTQSATGSAAYVINLPAAATPTFSPGAGAYASAQTVTISDGTPSATIYYTTNGSTPTTTSTVYSGAITVSANETLKAIAAATGYTASPVGSATYTINLPAATPTFSPGAGTYSSIQTVTISDGTSGATIYYTTNGTTPTTTSSVYSSPVTVSASETLKAIATASGYTQSATGSAAYTINLPTGSPAYVQQCNQFVQYGQSATCTLSGVGAGHTLVIGIVNTAVGQSGTVTASSGTPTLAVSDGSILSAYILPNTSAGSITITYSVTGNTRIWLSVVEYSNTAATPLDGTNYAVSAIYVTSFATPNFTTTTASDLLWSFSAIPAGGAQTAGTAPISWTALTTPSGSGEAVLLEDGDATTAGNYYGQFNAPSGASGYEIITLALKSGSGSPTAATPAFSPGAGTYSSAQTVTLSDSTPSSTIYYTTNGTTPTTTSSVYSAPISVSTSQTVEAIATASGYTQSPTASAAYIISLPQAAAPTFSPGAGTYSSAQTVTISDSTSGHTIYYTTNGTTPTTSSAVYSSPVTVSASETLEAIATASGYTQSATGSAMYTIGISSSPANGLYTIVNRSSGLLMDGGGANTAKGTWVVQDASNSANNTQVWGVTSLGNGTYQILNIGSSLSLDDYADATVNGAEIDVYTFNQSTGQTWSLTATSGGYYTIASQDIVNAGVDSCIEPSGGSTASGAEIVIYSCTSTNAEQWEFVPYTGANVPVSGTYEIQSLSSGLVLDGGGSGTTKGTWVVQDASTGGANQAWAITGLGSYTGTYQIVGVGNGLSLDDYADGNLNGTEIDVYSNNGSNGQIWALTPTSGGYYTLAVPYDARSFCIEPSGGSTASGAEIVLYNCTSTSAEQWNLVPVSNLNVAPDPPTFSPAAGNYTAGMMVTISSATPAATIYYTTNGTTPTTSSLVYSGPINVTTETIEAMATALGYTQQSGVGSATYIITVNTPTFSPAAGQYNSAQNVTISDRTPGVTIYYTTNGTTPTTSSTVYSSAINVSFASETVEAIATANGYAQSAVGSATYAIGLPAARPTFNPAAGTYSSVQTVTISDTTSGATIYYTTDGSTPTTSSTVYSSPIDVANSETLEAIATSSGYSQSALASAPYIIDTGASGTCDGMTLGTSVAGTANLNGFIPFQSASDMTSLWNTNILNAPVDPNNATIQATAGYSGEYTRINFGSSPGDGGIPFIIVDSSQTPSVPINVIDYADQSDVVVAPYPSGNAVPIEGAPSDCSGWPDTYTGNDAHTLVVDRNKCWAYETWNTNRCNGLYDASSETIWDMANGEMRPWGWTSADAAGLSVFAGLVKYDEAASGHINHAIRFTMQQTKNDANHGYFVEPASHAAGTSWGAPSVEGMRVRLSPTFNITGYSAINQAILTALQQYGMIVADNGGYFFIQGATDSRWNDSDLSNLAGIPSSDFSVIQTTPAYPGWDSVTAPTGSAPTINSFTASATQVSSGTPVTFSYSANNDSFDYIDMIGPVRLSSGSGSLTITPTATQTYTFYSTNAYGQAYATPVTVVVTGSVVTPPTFAPPAGTYTGAQAITLSSSTYPYAAIYYTTDGSTPTYPMTGTTQAYPVTPTPPNSNGSANSITVSASGTVKAIAVVPGYSSLSAVSSAIYIIN